VTLRLWLASERERIRKATKDPQNPQELIPMIAEFAETTGQTTALLLAGSAQPDSLGAVRA